MQIGFKLKKLREKNNISQEMLANMCEISQSKLSDIENNKRKKEIDFFLIVKLADIFELNLEYFLEGDREKSKLRKLEPSFVSNGNPNNILSDIQSLIDDNLQKQEKIMRLEAQIQSYKAAYSFDGYSIEGLPTF